jgi:major type 1 subunit fimbrin (pilin)
MEKLKFSLSYLCAILILIVAPSAALAQNCQWHDNQLITFTPADIKIPNKTSSAQQLAIDRGQISFFCPDAVSISVRILSAEGNTAYINGDCLSSPYGTTPPDQGTCKAKITGVSTDIQRNFMREAMLLGYSVGGNQNDAFQSPNFRAFFSANVEVPLISSYQYPNSLPRSGVYGGAVPAYRQNLLFKVALAGMAGTPPRPFSETRLYGVSPGTFQVDNSCTVTSQSNITISMGAVSTEQVTQNRAPDRPFAISLNCPQGTRVQVTASDNTNPSNRSNRLSLNSNAIAQGIAIKLTQANGQDLLLGQATPFTASNAGSFDLSFLARYVATGATIRPGSANATATFTLAYQ